MRRIYDSPAHEQLKAYNMKKEKRDSAARVRAAVLRARAGVVTAQRRRDSALAATKPYWGSKRYRLFYANVPSCPYQIEAGDLQVFDSREEAENAGFRRTTQMAC